MGTMAIPQRQPLPVGFRFQPTDKEVFDHYLRQRNLGKVFSNDVPDVDVTMLEPWELPAKFKDRLSYQGNDNEWWFFSARTWNQTTRRKTVSGKWSSTCGDKKIMDGEKNQIMGLMKTFAFHYAQGSSFKRLNWILHEYHLSNLDGLPLPDKKTYFVLCRLNYKKDDRARNKTGGEVENSGFVGIHQQEAQQTNSEFSSQARQRKRTLESMETPFGPVHQESIFTNMEQQIEDYFFSPYQPQSRENFFSASPLVESFGSDSSTLELSWGSSNASRSSGCFDFNRDIPSNSLEDQNVVLYYDEELQMELLLQETSESEPVGAPSFESLLHQDGLFREASSSAEQNTILLSNQRAQSAKSLSGIVPAEEVKISVENRNARPQLSSPLSPPAVRSPVIVADSKGFKESNSSSSAGSFPKAEARRIKVPTAAKPEWKNNSIVKIEEDEILAKETTEKLSLLVTQNQSHLSLPPSEFMINVLVVLVAFLICSLMLDL